MSATRCRNCLRDLGPSDGRLYCRQCRPRWARKNRVRLGDLKSPFKAVPMPMESPEPQREPLIREYTATAEPQVIKRGPPRGCRMCSDLTRKIYRCERCEGKTYKPLTLVNEELVCGKCVTREPDPTPEEIAEARAQIKAENFARMRRGELVPD